jgi:predicted GTPase
MRFGTGELTAKRAKNTKKSEYLAQSAYSDVSHVALMHLASRALSRGADFRFIEPERSSLKSARPVISIYAVCTGCEKDSVVRGGRINLRDVHHHLLDAAEIVDPRPAALGALIEVFSRYPWVGRALPAMGYSPSQLEDLAATIQAVDCDTIIVATPVDLTRLIPLPKPVCRARYDLEEISHPDLADIVSGFIRKHSDQLKGF